MENDNPMKIKPIDRDVRNLFESHFFVIPRFQRPYSWDRENLADFWNDVCEAPKPDYFIGSMVVYRSNATTAETFVVDGQQRLTTIILLLCAIRDRMAALGDQDLAVGLQGLIERPDIDSKKRYTLFSETPYPFLQDHIQKFGTPELEVEIGPEEEALKAAYDEFNSRLDQKLLEIDPRSGQRSDRKQSKKIDFLRSLRDRVLRLQTILVELDNEDDAYLIFETLNTRGKNLEPADLVKNHLTRLLRATNKDNDTTRTKWTRVVKTIHGAASDIDVNSYLLHQWLSERDYVAERRLFREIKEAISASNARPYLDTLLKESALYRTIFEVDYRKWRKEERAIKSSLKALQVFRIRQAVPAVLSLLRCYSDGEITKAQLELALDKLENFHFVFTAISSQRGSGGLASMYAKAARDIREARGKNNKQIAIKDFGQKLKDRVPPPEEFTLGFQSIQFSDQYTRERPLVRYILQKVDLHLGSSKRATDYDQYSIEHISPQAGEDIDDGVMSSIGNLIFVPSAVNSDELGSKDFKAKKAILSRHGVPLDTVLAKATTWSENEIRERTMLLSKMAYEEIWAI